MLEFSVHQAKTHLSKILKLVESNNEVVIFRYGKPVARVIPYETPGMKRKFGAMKDVAKFDESFFDPLPDDELAAWSE